MINKTISFLSEIPMFAIFNCDIPHGTIPSFIAHRFDAGEFEELLQYLKSNNYRTLGIDEYYDYLTGAKADRDRKVIITFDDGLRNNWTVIFPLLKKYEMKAVFYVNPSSMSEKPGPGPSLEDVWSGKISLIDLYRKEKEDPLISWDEARRMEDSGLVDIESHGHRHQICFIADNIVDFQRPDISGDPVYPWLYTAIGAERCEPIWGAPVYPFASRLKARCYFDNKGLRTACMNYVNERGAEDFFSRRGWRNELDTLVRGYKAAHPFPAEFETELEQELAIRDSLIGAQARIERELKKKCVHFAYPWHITSRISILWLKELGFKTVFRCMDPWRMPRKGSDPFDLRRIEAHWITSLPGKGRKSVWKRLSIRAARYSDKHSPLSHRDLYDLHEKRL